MLAQTPSKASNLDRKTPASTTIVKEAQDVGCKVVTGVEMFVRQAAEQFKIWHGKEPPDGVMRLALKQATSSVRIIE